MAGGRGLSGVRVVDIVEDSRPAREQYSPGHPDADANGIIRMPNISPIEAMVNMITATRAYEANLASLKQGKDMTDRSIDLGRRG